jgi:mannose/cellobiose epimerase-like protein (N-acyl-D-glucosamine 2-epimerase family)
MIRQIRIWTRLTAVLLLVGMVAVGNRQATAQTTQPNQTSQPIVSTRIPDWQIQEHISRDWLTKTITHDEMDYWVKYSVAPNGFIQEDLDRQWKHWGTQEEATVNGQGRQLLSMALVYEMNGEKNKEYLDAITRAANFLLRMRDPVYGGYYLRVGSDGHVIQDSKTGYQSFALYSLATVGRVTGEKKYLDAAMDEFRVIRDKMSDGSFFGSGGSYARDFKKIPGGPFGGASRGRGRGPSGFVDAMGWSSGYPPNALRGRPNFAAFGGSARVHCIDLHMFEALMGLYHATKSPEVWKELQAELDGISRVYDYKVGYLPACYDANWKPVGPPTANPGHFLFEWASELSRAVDLGADPKFIGLGNRILDFAVKNTYNTGIGGLGAYNAQGQPTPMLWWPQCEVVKATGMYAILHGREDLWPYFHETLDFIRNNYFDTQDGGWFEWYFPGKTLAEQGARAFYKGSVDGPEWGAYHPTMLFYQLWRITAPDYKPWPRHGSN